MRGIACGCGPGQTQKKERPGAGLAPAQNSTVARSSTWRASPIEMR